MKRFGIFIAWLAINVLAVAPAVYIVHDLGGGWLAFVLLAASLVWHEFVREMWVSLMRGVRP